MEQRLADMGVMVEQAQKKWQRENETRVRVEVQMRKFKEEVGCSPTPALIALFSLTCWCHHEAGGHVEGSTGHCSA